MRYRMGGFPGHLAKGWRQTVEEPGREHLPSGIGGRVVPAVGGQDTWCQPDLKCWRQNGAHGDLGFVSSFPLFSLQSIWYSIRLGHVQPVESQNLFRKGLCHSLG